MIRSFTEDSHRDLHLPLLTAAYRSTKHPATGFSPNLMLGREVNLPVDIIFPSRQQDDSKECDYVLKLESCYEIARENLRRAAERQKRDYDTRAGEKKYCPGDLVYKRHAISKKLETPWVGPYVVIQRLSDCVYKITDKRKASVLHHDQIKLL